MSLLSKTAERKLKGSFILLTLVLFYLTFLSYKNSKQNEDASKWVIHTNKVLYISETILSSAIDIESGQGRFLITGDRHFLEDYNIAKKNILIQINDLKSITKDNLVQQRRIDTLTFLTKQRLELLSKIIAIRYRTNTVNELMITMSYDSKSLLDKFRGVIERSQEAESNLLKIRILKLEAETNSFYQTLTFLIITEFIILLLSYVFIFKYIRIKELNEKEIRQNWQMMQSILDNTNSSIYIKDLTGKYLLVNNKFARHLGKQKNEIIGTKPGFHTSSEIAQKQLELENQVALTKQTIENEEKFTYKDKIYHTIYSRFPILDEQNNVSSICGVITDISEIKKAESQLTYQSNMIHNASDAFIGTDLNFNITFWNRSAEILFGFKEKDALQKNVFHLLDNKNTSSEKIETFILKKLYSNDTWHGEFRFEPNDERIVPISTSISFIKNDDNVIIGILAVNRDITDKVKTQEAILQLNKELEDFTYTVSHDLRTPLRAIDGYSRILFEDYYNKVDEEGKNTIQVIAKNATKMGKLIDDLLTFTRMGRQASNKSNLDMNEIINESLLEFKNGIELRMAKLTIDKLPNCIADLNMMRIVWSNLISNALKFSSKKEIAMIEIGGYTNKNEHIFYIKDNGAGFDMQYIHKLYGIFQRLHRQDMFDGNGIGLAQVYRIITKHKGRVWAEGEIEKGSTFYFSIPNNNDTTL